MNVKVEVEVERNGLNFPIGKVQQGHMILSDFELTWREFHLFNFGHNHRIATSCTSKFSYFLFYRLYLMFPPVGIFIPFPLGTCFRYVFFSFFCILLILINVLLYLQAVNYEICNRTSLFHIITYNH